MLRERRSRMRRSFCGARPAGAGILICGRPTAISWSPIGLTEIEVLGLVHSLSNG